MSSSLGYPFRYIETLFRAVSPNKLELQSILSNVTSATAAASAGPLDKFYARIGALNGPFFPSGWGNLSVVNYEEDLRHLIVGPPSNIQLSWRLLERGRRNGTDYLLYEGTFRTPCLQRVFDALPPESRTGRVQLLMPAHLKPFEPGSATPSSSTTSGPAASAANSPLYSSQGTLGMKPADAPACVVHLAATGDQTFGRRLRLGFPLLKDNVCAMVLESPFYGARRPAAQRGSKLLRVSDLLTLGWATIAESVNLLHWLREEGYGALGMCGLSMGGVHASMTAGLFPGDVAVTPLLAPRSAAVAYCDGAMRAAMAWEPLLKEVDENNNRITQVVMAAGRAVRVEIPVPVGGAQSSGSDSGSSHAGPAQAVALMREATYALVDLEVRGEKRHLAEEPRTESGSVPSEAVSGYGSEFAAEGVAGDGSRCSSASLATTDAAKAQEAWYAGISAFRGGLPFVSVMDLQSALARTFLWGSGGANATNAAHGPALPQQQRDRQKATMLVQSEAVGPQPVASNAAAAALVDDYAGPFSGMILQSNSTEPKSCALSKHGCEQHLQVQHQPQQQQQQQQCHKSQGTIARPTSAGAPPPGGQRSHPQPHQPDMPFPSSALQQRPHSSSGSEIAALALGSVISPSGGSASGDGGGGGTALGRRLLGDLGRAVKQLRAGDRRLDRPETVLRLKQVLETYTDITRYPCPRRTDAAIIVAARDDAYVSCESVQQLHRYWQGSELRIVTGGHVSAFLMHQEAFREAIRDSLARVARSQPPE